METLLILLNALNLLDLKSRARLELLVLCRIARELDRSAVRVEELRALVASGPSIHSRIVNASMQVKVAAGGMKVLGA